MSNFNEYLNTCKKDDCLNRFTNSCNICIHAMNLKTDNYKTSASFDIKLRNVIKEGYNAGRSNDYEDADSYKSNLYASMDDLSKHFD